METKQIIFANGDIAKAVEEYLQKSRIAAKYGELLPFHSQKPYSSSSEERITWMIAQKPFSIRCSATVSLPQQLKLEH